MLHSFLDEHINFVYHGMRSSHPGFNATVHRNFDQKIDTVSLMPQDIGRVIINLLSNAFYAVYQKAQMPEKEAYEPEVTIRTHRSGNRICIDFIDNGTGIPRHLQKKIFEPFFTTKPTGEGTGLGLSLSYEIVTQGHGGKLTLMSEEGEGASFSVELPA